MHILRTTNDVKPDERSYDLHRLLRLPVNGCANVLYTKVYPIHTIYEIEEMGPGRITEEERTIMMNNVAATDDKLSDDGIYLVDTNETIYVYVRKLAEAHVLMSLFGHDNIQMIMENVTGLPSLEDDYNIRVSNIIEQLRKNKNASYQNVRVVVQGDPFEPYMLQNYFVEDENKYGESLTDFLCNVHSLIQKKYN